MSSQSIVCVSCGAAVPYGRLSCPACGELLASVAGAPRIARAAVAEPAPKRAGRGARAGVAVAPAPAAPAPAAPASASRATPSVLVDMPSNDHEPQWPQSLPATPAPAVVKFTPGPPAPAAYSSVATPIANAPGAYVPPVVPAMPAGPPAPARAWAGHSTAEAPDGESGDRSKSSMDELVDPARMAEFIGWLAVAGSAMAAVGFLLPWGISVIGASGVDYFDRWGLAGPFHPIVALGLLAVLGLALVRNPIPLWIRVGLAGFGLGALLLGLVWPYLFSLPGRGPGVLVVAAGAILLSVAGVVALVADRHADADQAV
jgi:hypothetical protein